MFMHIVMWDFESEDKTQKMNEIKTQLEALPDMIPEIQRYEVGLDLVHAEHSCDMVLVSGFTDSTAFKQYAAHPEHQKVVQAISQVTIARKVVDYVI